MARVNMTFAVNFTKVIYVAWNGFWGACANGHYRDVATYFKITTAGYRR